MADYERPVNEIDFKSGEQPETFRQEEEFMYKYLQNAKEKKPKKLDEAEFADDASDPELEAFAE
jgi:hypothetical protein